MSLTVDKCLQAWTNSLRQMNAKADIVFFGDSLTYYGDFASVFPGKVVCNLGLRGDTIQGMINRVTQVKILEPRLVFVMTGINDVGCNHIDEFDKSYGKLVDELNVYNVVLQSILPVNTNRFTISCNNDQIIKCNSVIKTISEKKGCGYLDLYSIYEEKDQLPTEMTKDGIHLTEAAYYKWYSALMDFKNNCL